MKKINLLLSVLLVFIFCSLSISATVSTITNVTGNVSSPLEFTYVTTQTTTNPEIGENISYITSINVTTGTATVAGKDVWNITSFNFVLPDNATTSTSTDFNVTVTNLSATHSTVNNGTFVNAAENYVNFHDVGWYFNNTANGTIFNITWMLDSPISSTKIATSQSGRAYTETWNITSTATNQTIDNASLTVRPSYWYTRIGNPTTITFNGTSKLTNYTANFTDIEVWTDLTLLSSNLLPIDSGFGGGWATLSITYNGPTIDASSGSASSTTISTLPDEQRRLGLYLGVILVIIVVVGLAITLVYLLKKK